MKIDPKKFQVTGRKKVRLKKWATSIPPFYQSQKHYQKLLAADVGDLSALQRLLYASNTYSILLVFQGMDAAGKDGAIGHVLSGVNPQGCEVFSFKQPSPAELEHDFLWRTTCRLPGRGRIGVFNRSYYEEVQVVRVHRGIFRRERIPPELTLHQPVWRQRFRSIIDLEKHLHRNGTRVIKFFLHLSKEEQRQRFLARLDEPDKNWKFSLADIAERKFWHEYRRDYEDCLGATSTKASPWYVVPADDKLNARLIISRVVIATLRSLKLRAPEVTGGRRRELREIRRQLEK